MGHVCFFHERSFLTSCGTSFADPVRSPLTCPWVGWRGSLPPPIHREEALALLKRAGNAERAAHTSCSAWYSLTVMFLWKPASPALPSTPRLVITMGCSTRKLTLTTRSLERPEGGSSGKVNASISWFRTEEGQ